MYEERGSNNALNIHSIHIKLLLKYCREINILDFGIFYFNILNMTLFISETVDDRVLFIVKPNSLPTMTKTSRNTNFIKPDTVYLNNLSLRKVYRKAIIFYCLMCLV